MYHRNKVHTDEFWRYELTKNRRGVMDDKANEDLWKKQLGKHSSTTPAQPGPSHQKSAETAAAAALAALAAKADVGQETSSSIIPGSAEDTDANVTTEIKLLALQSLQNSLRFFSGLGTVKTEAQLETQQQDTKESYLNLLAQLAKKESEERVNNNNNNNPGDEQTTYSSNDLPTLPTGEESSVKRTQMWLQQVNKYRHKVPKEELESNHDELWEQQISRVKKNPVRSPLEPEEIIIEDEVETDPAPRHSRSSTFNNNNNIVINNNNNNNNDGGVAIFPARIILAHPVVHGSPGSATLTLQNNFLTTAGQNTFLSPTHGSQPLKVFLHQPVVAPVPVEPQQQQPGPAPRDSSPASWPQQALGNRASVSSDQSRANTPASRASTNQESGDRAAANERPANDQQDSMLKSLLMDRVSRKRSGSDENTDAASKKSTNDNNASNQSTKPGESSKLIHIPEAPKDILRKRLLGWVDPPAEQANQRPASRPASNASANQRSASNASANQRSGTQEEMFPMDLESNQGTSQQNKSCKKENVVTYANTSVLKHLLHRYTDSNGC